jgi:methylmalonyl-CoA/ethylmalonyl-CoA epimerase
VKARLDHIGIAVADLGQALAFYRDALGLEVEPPEDVPSQRVRAHFVRVGEATLELLEPTAPDSTIAKFIADRGEGIHHVAFRTDDIGAQLKQAAGAGVRLIHEQPFEGAAGKLVAFLHPKSTRGVLTEFCAVKPGATAAH